MTICFKQEWIRVTHAAIDIDDSFWENGNCFDASRFCTSFTMMVVFSAFSHPGQDWTWATRRPNWPTRNLTSKIAVCWDILDSFAKIYRTLTLLHKDAQLSTYGDGFLLLWGSLSSYDFNSWNSYLDSADSLVTILNRFEEAFSRLHGLKGLKCGNWR